MNSQDNKPAKDRRADIPPPPDDIEVEAESPPPDPDSLRAMFQDPGVRNYLFAGLAALAMVFVTLFQKGVDPVGGVLLVVVGGAGMVLRWPASPHFFLLILLWFLIFPFGLPPPDENPFELEDGRLRVADILLAASVVVFLASNYRLIGLTTQALPFEQRYPAKSQKPIRRPPELIRPGEIARLLYLTAGVALAGQLVWLFVTSVELDDAGTIPLRLVDVRQRFRRGPSDGMPPALNRFILVSGLVFFGTLLARLVFGYWRLRIMSPAEGGMLLQDAAWDETRREQMRVARWRAWGWRRAAEQDEAAKRADQSERGRPR
ncbi:MAG: hypothetical protein JWO38_6468 [Gemmataceae bacterium]|nr:hypothetical protein [Gemmataceae bacterium]